MGFFSWITQDTGESIANTYSDRHTFSVTMTDDKGNKWVENDYEGYGVFGGKDYYELLDEMNRDTNGARGDRDSGIDIAYGERPFIAPSLSRSGRWFTGQPERCPDQGYFYEDDE